MASTLRLSRAGLVGLLEQYAALVHRCPVTELDPNSRGEKRAVASPLVILR